MLGHGCHSSLLGVAQVQGKAAKKRFRAIWRKTVAPRTRAAANKSGAWRGEKTARRTGFEKDVRATVSGRIFSTFRRVSMKSKAIGAFALLLTASMPAL